MKKKLIALLLVLSMVMPFMGSQKVEATDTQTYITLAVEKFTLGQGYSLEPIKVAVEETESVGAVVARILGKDNFKGSVNQDTLVYLESVRDESSGEVNVPQFILDQSGPIDTKADEAWLSAFDYTFMSGWMYSVNNVFPSVGMADQLCKDGDVIRVQFTLHGYGADLGGGFDGNYAEIANRTQLTSLVGDINSRPDKETLLQDGSIKSAYDLGVQALENLLTTQTSMDQAWSQLNLALEQFENQPSPLLPVAQETLKASQDFIYSRVTNPREGSVGGDWVPIALARGGYTVPASYYETYYNNVKDHVESKNGILSTTNFTEYSRIILGLTAAGKDPRAVGDYDLTAYLGNFDNVKKQGINGPIYALIALDSYQYDIPTDVSATTQTTRQLLIDYILSKEIKKGTANAGGFALGTTAADPDITAMALQALTPYKNQPEVAAAIDRAVLALSKLQTTAGSFTSWGATSSESISQVIVALSGLDIDPARDSRFVKNGNNLVSALLTFYSEPDKGFRHSVKTTPELMSTEQAAMALAAYVRMETGKNTLYNMTDQQMDIPVEKEEKVTEDGVTTTIGKEQIKLTGPTQSLNKAGSTFKVTLSASAFPAGEYALLDGVLSIPSQLEVVEATSGQALSGGQLSYHNDGQNQDFRFAYTNFQLDKITGNVGQPTDLIEITLRVKEDIDIDLLSSLSIEPKSVSLKENSENMRTFDCSQGLYTIQIIKEAVDPEPEDPADLGKVVDTDGITVRVLYQGDGIDIIPANKTAVAIEIPGLDTLYELKYDDKIPVYYSKDISEKRGQVNYVAIIDESVTLEALKDTSAYKIKSKTAESVEFGDVNKDEIINAQDAVDTLSTWLRKSKLEEDKSLLLMNVTGDKKINTLDVLSLMENYTSDKPFKVINQ